MVFRPPLPLHRHTGAEAERKGRNPECALTSAQARHEVGVIYTVAGV